MHTFIKTWTDHNERMEIAREVGITTRQQVSNVMRGKNKNFILLQRLIAKAKENLKAVEEARALEKTILAP